MFCFVSLSKTTFTLENQLPAREGSWLVPKLDSTGTEQLFLLALSLLRGAELFKGCVESLMGRMETPKGSAE